MPLEKIASFTIDHTRLLPGIYVSRVDRFGHADSGVVLTTFDLRFKRPNLEPVIDMPALHTLEHLLATFFRNDADWGSRVVYVGPMGCRTGMYAILEGILTSADVLPLVKKVLSQVIAFKGDIPGAAPAECGNWREQNLDMAQYEARRYLDLLDHAAPENLNYPA
jgi:S-ribosylhomocysteine lyase